MEIVFFGELYDEKSTRLDFYYIHIYNTCRPSSYIQLIFFWPLYFFDPILYCIVYFHVYSYIVYHKIS